MIYVFSGDIYWSVPSEIAKVVETWSEKRDLVDDIRDKVYYRDIVPCFKITQVRS